VGKIFKDQAGRIGYRRDDEEADHPLPEGAVEVIEVDFDTNAELLESLNREINLYRLEGGALYRDGEAVVFAPETERRALRRAVAALNGKRVADLSAAEFRLLVALLALEAGWLARDGTLRL
jgi:hypothetical protein